MIPHTILRIPNAEERQRSARELADYVVQRFLDQYQDTHPHLLARATANWWSDYYKVSVFLTDRSLAEEAEEWASQLEKELAREGVPSIIFVRVWTGPGARRNSRKAATPT
jgi:hypothetical protein